jgi:hypothetical protein
MLYALPDHEVMENLLPEIRNRYIPADEAYERVQNNPGLIPVAVNPTDNGLVYFADISDTPLVEWKFIYTIERLAAENAVGESFATDLSILEREDLSQDGMLPDGLIFHVSRCGSTLFTKAIARSPNNLIINQGGPLQEGFWAAITDHWQHAPEINQKNITMLRNLVKLMARKRRPEYQFCFVKFISWNIIYLDLIRAAFPESAAIYLYRNPVEVIATVLQETTAVLRAKGHSQAYSLTGLCAEETAKMSDVEYLAYCYAHYFKVVLDGSDTNQLSLVNYQQLKHVEAFDDILARGFRLRPEEAQLALMRQQYRYFSKDDSDTIIFNGDAEYLLDILPGNDKQMIRDICAEGLTQLDQSDRHLFPTNQVMENVKL